MFSILGDKLDVQVRGLLEGEIKASDPKPFQMAKSVFQSCMDKETIEVSISFGKDDFNVCSYPDSRAGAVKIDPEEDGRLAVVGGTCLE